MKLRMLTLALAALSLSAQAETTNVIRMSAPIVQAPQRPTVQQIEYGEWITSSQSCTAFSPITSQITFGQSFSQTRTCSVEESRAVTQWTYYQGTQQRFDPVSLNPEARTRQQAESQMAVGAQAVETGCKYSTASPGYSWDSKRSTKDNTLIWAGVVVYQRTGLATQPPIDANGFRYTRGGVKLDEGTNPTNIHRITEICRTKL
ncbi:MULTISPECIES: hypothetical protein [Pseudomonas]|uniref:hypothetical protein n=1 Tax=Pseudomonas TaxID=286 RepID=UPI000F012931|nr:MULTISPECIES: hypothetical protein [Pseudomonas]MBD8615594.1 hypothetical protein [Pseudomonas putida]MBD8681754.1 hypothetical protein [Pseudomonas sp. CFBP 13719]